MTDTTATATIELPPIANLDVPAAWAPELEREAIKGILQDMLTNGWSRPMISAITGFSDSQVYRAKEGAAHTIEVERWNAFLQGVKDGVFRPTERARKANAKQMLERAQRAAAMLAQADGMTKAAEIKKLVAEALALLPTPVAADADDTESATEPAPVADQPQD